MEERIYIIVPKTVQTIQTAPDPDGWSEKSEVRNIRMESGRLMAQCSHVGRKLEHQFEDEYREITTIVLSVRNSRELKKVTKEIAEYLMVTNPCMKLPARCTTFEDTNPDLYGTFHKVHTATAVGPVTQEFMDPVIGHLELYS